MKNKLTIAIIVLIVASAFRLFPHPHNVAPVAAIALFGGSVISNRLLKFLLPLVVLLLSDTLVNGLLYNMPFNPFYDGWYVQYMCYALIVGLGMLVQHNKAKTIVAGSLAASILFFITTNLAVWASGMVGYPMNMAGLTACYTAAIPFFINAIAGDLMFSALLFGVFAYVTNKQQISQIITQ
jgi:hypothetical protein